jgi:hypothetical protein
MNEIKNLIVELRKNPLSTMLAVCIAAIGILCLYIKAEAKQHGAALDSAKRELIDTERRCGLEIDAIRKEQLLESREAAERQTIIEAEIRRLIKSKR